MLTDDVRVDRTRIECELPPEAVPEASRVEHVPVPMTRAFGSPLATVATRVMTSTGFVTITSSPRSRVRRSAMPRMIVAFSRIKSSRLSPARPPRPAAMTTASAPVISSIEAERTSAVG